MKNETLLKPVEELIKSNNELKSKMTVRELLMKNICPYCGGNVLKSEEYWYNAGKLRVSLWCQKCDKEWGVEYAAIKMFVYPEKRKEPKTLKMDETINLPIEKE